MNENFEGQQKLMELIVDKVLKKHGVLEKRTNLDHAERVKIAEVVENIKTEVERFLENSVVATTENDFPNVNAIPAPEVVREVFKKNKIFNENNDVKAVRTFLNNQKRK